MQNEVCAVFRFRAIKKFRRKFRFREFRALKKLLLNYRFCRKNLCLARQKKVNGQVVTNSIRASEWFTLIKVTSYFKCEWTCCPLFQKPFAPVWLFTTLTHLLLSSFSYRRPLQQTPKVKTYVERFEAQAYIPEDINNTLIIIYVD